MESPRTRRKWHGLSCVIVFSFYFLQNLLGPALQAKSVELSAILWILSVLGLTVCFVYMLVSALRGRLRFRLLGYTVAAFLGCSLVYGQFSTGARARCYLLLNEVDIEKLLKEVSKVSADQWAVGVMQKYPFIRLSYFDVMFSDYKSLRAPMNRLCVYDIKKHSRYTELSVSGFSTDRSEELTLLYTSDRDCVGVIDLATSHSLVSEMSGLTDNWYYIVRHYNSLQDRVVVWGCDEQRLPRSSASYRSS